VTSIAGTAALLVGLLGVAVLVALAAERLRVPGAVALVAFGAGTAAIHPVALPFHFGDALLFIFLPPLIFEAAWSIDPAALRRTAIRVVLLALPGVVLVTGAIGFGIALTGQLPLAAAMLFGAIVSATDPVAVIAIFRRLHVPVDLMTIVEGESIANDGVAIVLYALALAFASGAVENSVLAASVHAVVAIVGGIVIGLACAVAVGFVMGRSRSGPLEIAATVVLAFLAYLSADALQCSGVFATAAAGSACGRSRASRR
jgi:monovalent cation:H+ antiporter, CPA1 family